MGPTSAHPSLQDADMDDIIMTEQNITSVL